MGMGKTYIDRRGARRFKDSNIPVYKWIAWKKKQNNSPSIEIPYWIKKYAPALILELILLIYKVPSKEDIHISLIQTILPLSPATQPLSPFITLIAIILQIYPLFIIGELISKIIKHIKKKLT